MVQIYRWSELAKGKFASKENLQRARKEAISLMRKLHARGWIESGCIFGSVARGDYATGSDFDVLLISRPEKEAAVQRYLQKVFRRSIKEFGVKPELIHINSKEARTGNHSIDASLFQHIGADLKKQSTVGKNPLKMIRIRRSDLAANKRDRILFQIHSARKRIIEQSFNRIHDKDAYYKALEHSIERTIHAARWVLELQKALPMRRGKVDDRKKSVVTAYCERFAGNKVATEALQRVVDASASYQTALARAVEALKTGKRKKIIAAKKSYQHALKEIEATGPLNIRFFEENVKIINAMKSRQRRKRLIAKRKPARKKR